MSNEQPLSDAEINTIKALQQKKQSFIREFGESEVQSRLLDHSRHNLETNFAEHLTHESAFYAELRNTYSNGMVELDRLVYIPTN